MCKKVLLLCLFTLLLSPSVLWSQPSSLPDSSRLITISYENWKKINDYVTRLEKIQKTLSSETASLKVNSVQLLAQVAKLQEQLRASLITNDELKVELEKVRQSLEALEKSSEGLGQKIITIQTERDIALVGCGVLGVAVIVVTIIALTK